MHVMLSLILLFICFKHSSLLVVPQFRVQKISKKSIQVCIKIH